MRNTKSLAPYNRFGPTNAPGTILVGSDRGVRSARHDRARVVREKALPGEDRETPRGGGGQVRET